MGRRCKAAEKAKVLYTEKENCLLHDQDGVTKGSNRFLPCRAARGTHKSPVEPEGDGQTGPHSFGILAIKFLPTPGCAARACTQLPCPSSVPQGARRGSPQVTATAHPRGPGPHKKTTSRGSPASRGLLFPAALIPPSQQHLEAASCPDPPLPGMLHGADSLVVSAPDAPPMESEAATRAHAGGGQPGPPETQADAASFQSMLHCQPQAALGGCGRGENT